MEPAGRDRRFALHLALLLLTFLAIESIYVARFPMVMDELGSAYYVHHGLHDRVPYRDYSPYKNVLGYYVQLPLLLLPFATWTNLLLVKYAMALLAAGVLFIAAWMLRTLFDRRAVLSALALLLAMSTFLERCAELRVDAMTGLAGLLSFVLLLRKRPATAGMLSGLSFLISQKGVYYGTSAAAGVALALAVASSARRETLRTAIRFGLATIATIGVYVTFWAALSSPLAVWNSMFVFGTQIAAVA
ncbi:MAG: hypothetical protein ABI837_09325, partial [Acidobacteriota bacterium]